MVHKKLRSLTEIAPYSLTLQKLDVASLSFHSHLRPRYSCDSWIEDCFDRGHISISTKFNLRHAMSQKPTHFLVLLRVESTEVDESKIYFILLPTQALESNKSNNSLSFTMKSH
ncbi:hypothetical protein SUGI_0835990 [Cryptomeria japonica]|nr:hypothetical protein SUGI_0835990 [Cryptomeria japonica]